MICRRCGKVSELHDHEVMKSLIQRMCDAGYQIDCREVEIASICPGCH
jgi:Fe2+ or Zn2+ uptake regulation protein